MDWNWALQLVFAISCAPLAFWWCCCGQSGSGGGSVSGIRSCCIDEIGTWPAAWPANLTLTTSGGCCAGMNFSVTLPQDLAFVFPKYGGVRAGQNCVGDELFPGLSLVCSSPTDGWLLNGGFYAECQPQPPVGFGGSLVFTVHMTLLSCVPFHAVGTMTFAVNPSYPTRCCNGTLNLEITE